MKKNIALFLILTTLLCLSSCGDKIHKSEIEDEYFHEEFFGYEDGNPEKIGWFEYSLSGATLERVKERIVYYDIIGNEVYNLPKEGYHKTADGEWFVLETGMFGFRTGAAGYDMMFGTVRIFDIFGFLKAEASITFIPREKDNEDYRWSIEFGDDISKYLDVACEEFSKDTYVPPKSKVHMDDIEDNYKNKVWVFEQIDLKTGRCRLEDVKKAILENKVLDENSIFMLPTDGEYKTSDGEKFILKTGSFGCLFSTYFDSEKIYGTVRIFDSRGYLVLDKYVWFSPAEEITDEYWQQFDEDIREYLKIACEEFKAEAN